MHEKKVYSRNKFSTRELLLLTLITLSFSFLMDSSNSAPPVSFAIAVDDRSLSQVPEEQNFDYSQRSQWLRAAVLGANDGLVSIASLMMGIGAVKEDVKVMFLTGFAGLVAGACSMAIGEFVSVYSQLEIELAQIKRNEEMKITEENNNEELPNPVKAALASALAFTAGAIVPLLAAAFIGNHKVRLPVVAAAVTLALIGFGSAGAVLGRAPVLRSSARVLLGGWMAMAITYGLTKGISSGGMKM